MKFRFRAAAAAALLALAFSAHAADRKPLVNIAGQVQPIPATDTLQTPAPTTANASINLPHGTAPSSPANGDCWTTTSGLFCRVNGSTVGPMGAGGGSPGGSSGQIQYNNSGAFGGFTASGDATVNTSTGAVSVSKTGGVSFATSATTDTTNAANISTGVLGASRGGAGTVTGILKANGSGVVSAASSGTDYAPATSGSSILYGDGSGGFSSATVGTGLTFSAGSLTANFASPPVIGSGTPAAGHFTTLSATGTLTTAVTGSTQCLQVNSSGDVSGTGSACGAGTTGGGRLIAVRYFTSGTAATYTPTAGTASVIIELVGAGGGGAGANTVAAAQSYIGAGGGAGAWLRVRLTSNFSGGTYTIGSFGAGGAAGVHDGSNGGSSTFTTTAGSPVTYTAGGGVGGGHTSGGLAQVVGPTTGGVASGGTPDISMSGGPSQPGLSPSGPFFAYSGQGGTSLYSVGAAVAAFIAANPGSAAGVNANGFGGGGSGAVVNSTGAAKAGGDGSGGLMIVWEFS